MRYLFCDTAYPEVVQAALRDTTASDWRALTADVLARGFGTWDSWAHAMGGETAILNLPDFAGSPFAEPWDVIHVQAIGYHPPEFWAEVKARTGARLVGEFSHAAPSDAHLAQFDRLLTGFPHYARDYGAKGWPIRYLPLAFDPRRREQDPGHRDLPLTFVGGLGVARHWQAGLRAMEAVAEAFPDFAWYGYRGDDVGADSPLGRAWRGPVWGHDYYTVLARSQITLNRHGEVHFDSAAQAAMDPPFVWACNLRLYEATGMGACLLTEGARNLGRITDDCPSLFEPGVEVLTWGNPTHLCEQIERCLQHPEYVAEVARRGQRRTLEHHTYQHRADALREWLDG